MKFFINNKNMFFISYILTLCSWMMNNVSYIQNILNYMRYFSYFILVIIIFLNHKKFTLKRIVVEILGTAIVVVSSYFSKSNTILTLWIFILAVREIDFDELIKVDFYTKFVLVFIVVLCYYLGFTEKNEFYGYFGNIRSSIGFGNPNTFGYYIFSLCADYIYSNNNRIKLKHSIVLIIISFIVGYLSNSRTSQFLIVLLAFSTPIAKILKNIVKNKYFKIFILSLFFICSLSSVYICKNYDSSNDVYYNLNEALSGRIFNAHRFLEKYDVSIIGNEIELKTNDNSYSYYLDNGYIKLLLNYGILVFMIIYIIYLKDFKKAFRNNNIFLILIFSIYLFYGLTENVMFWLSGNAFLLYFACENKKVSLEE